MSFFIELVVRPKREMLIIVLGALVKESIVISIILELVLSIPQKHKKFYFHFKISVFLTSAPGRPETPVNVAHFC